MQKNILSAMFIALSAVSTVAVADPCDKRVELALVIAKARDAGVPFQDLEKQRQASSMTRTQKAEMRSDMDMIYRDYPEASSEGIRKLALLDCMMKEK